MKTKVIPFNLEMAKKIQKGDIDGRIVTNEGNEVKIIRFDLIQNSFPILAIIRIPNVVSDYWEDAKLFQLNGRHENEKLWLEIELPEEAPKHEFKPFDRVLCRDCDSDEWQCDIFSHIQDDTYRIFPYATVGHMWRYCIPYEGNEHLVGTTDKPKED